MYAYLCVYTNIYIHTHMHLHMYVCVYVCVFVCVCVCVCVYVCSSYLPTPPLGQDMTQGQILSGVLQVWIQSFSFS